MTLRFPLSLQTESIQTADDLELHRIAPGLLGAFFRAHIEMTDLHGRSHHFEQVCSGIAATEEHARLCCFMEAIERVSATSDLVMRETTLISDEGPPWFDFFPYLPEQIQEAERFRRGWPSYRVEATSLINGSKTLLPAEAVFPWWRAFFATPSPRPETDGSGIAASFVEDRDRAVRSAFFEVLERDAVMLSWRAEGWPVRPQPVHEFVPADLLDWLEERELELRLYDVGDPELCPVFMALLVEQGRRVALGSSSGKGERGDAIKATQEALMIADTARGSVGRRRLPSDHEVESSYDHILWSWENGEAVLDWYDRQAANTTAPSAAPQDLLQASVRRFGCTPWVVDLTAPAIAQLGCVVLRVVIAHAYRKEYAHQKRYLGGPRLKQLGLKPETLNSLPHPVG